MPGKKAAASQEKRAKYNDDYQKKYIKRYVFKLNTKHDQELIELLEQMENRSEWFKQQLSEAVR